jgi:hypothetical protein
VRWERERGRETPTVRRRVTRGSSLAQAVEVGEMAAAPFEVNKEVFGVEH